MEPVISEPEDIEIFTFKQTTILLLEEHRRQRRGCDNICNTKLDFVLDADVFVIFRC